MPEDNQNEGSKPSSMRPWVVWVSIVVLIVVFLSYSRGRAGRPDELRYDDFVSRATNSPSLVLDGKIKPKQNGLFEITGFFVATNKQGAVKMKGNKPDKGNPFRIETLVPESALEPILMTGKFESVPENTLLMTFLFTMLPFALIIFFIYFKTSYIKKIFFPCEP